MKITKARLVEIINEEIQNLEEFRLGNIFGRGSKPSTRGGYKAAGERGPESKDALADRVDDEIAKLGSKGRQIASVATMDANLHSDKKDAEQDQAIQSLSSRFDTLDDPGEVGDSLLGDDEFVNQMRAKVASGKLFRTTFLPRIKAAIKQASKTDQEAIAKQLEDPKFIDTLIAKINQRQHKAGEE